MFLLFLVSGITIEKIIIMKQQYKLNEKIASRQKIKNDIISFSFLYYSSMIHNKNTITELIPLQNRYCC